MYGGGQVGTAIARKLHATGRRATDRARPGRAREVAEQLPGCRVFNATGVDPDFLERERIGRAQAAVFAIKRRCEEPLRSDPRARARRPLHDRDRARPGLDEGLRAVRRRRDDQPARRDHEEEIVRFAHDPRTQQVGVLDGDRYEVLDITTRPSSEYVGLRFGEMPIRGALIGAIVRGRQPPCSRAATTCSRPATA